MKERQTNRIGVQIDKTGRRRSEESKRTDKVKEDKDGEVREKCASINGCRLL